MGAFVIVKSSSLDSLYEGLPVLIVDDYERVNREFLKISYRDMQEKSFSMEKLTADYWLAKIDSFKNQ